MLLKPLDVSRTHTDGNRTRCIVRSAPASANR